MCSLPQRVAVAFRHLPFKKESSKKHHFLLKTVPSAFPGLSGCFCRKRRAGVRGDPPEPGRRGKPVPQPRRASSSRSDCYFGTKTLHSGRILIVLCLKGRERRKESFISGSEMRLENRNSIQEKVLSPNLGFSLDFCEVFSLSVG